ncbi:hypothetical protein L2E82_19654 [Cichorium intybus]|uniref:Uncharacterized protein n=1 Tax=Cichorium intybus TaxID=13427 RepID=A0ACB9FBX3_CICIN|nr:hypothetical protein L2E82_19654 [Cichorium intybus]
MSSTCSILPGICFLPVVKHTTFRRTVSARFKPLSSVRSPVVSRKQPLMTTMKFEADSTLKGDHLEKEVEHFNLKDYFEQSRNLLMKSDGGPPRWFSPLECGSRLTNSPLLLSLPGVDGTGLSLLLHHQRLGQVFDIWCLHIPTTDRTPFTGLVKLVEKTVTFENHKFPDRPIYLVGESVGACLALAVAARIPHIDLVLLLANPDVPSRMLMSSIEKGFPSQQTIIDLSEVVAASFSYFLDLGDVLTVETVLWKLNMIESACEYSNSCLDSVTSQTLILTSGNDQLLLSIQEGERLYQLLPKSEIRKFTDYNHALFLEEKFDMLTVIKGAGFYRRTRYTNYASDILPPSPHEIKRILDSARWLDIATCPVMLSTLENGKIVRSFSGIPSEGPVLFVGYHNMLALDVAPMILGFIREQNIFVRGAAHPLFFKKLRREGGKMPDPAIYDVVRVLGAVPVSASNLYKLFSIKSHVLLYPGGVREALHRKGEEYKLFWPEQSEFVRMAARFGATIIPFGAVGEDDYTQLVLDYDDQMKIPFVKDYIKEITGEFMKLRNDMEGEIASQDLYFPILIPKVPGRYYYLFGKPIKTEGRRQELGRNREKAQQVYIEVKREVEKCIEYCKRKREYDPYRNIIPRFMYQATHGLESQVPTFDLD